MSGNFHGLDLIDLLARVTLVITGNVALSIYLAPHAVVLVSALVGAFLSFPSSDAPPVKGRLTKWLQLCLTTLAAWICTGAAIELLDALREFLRPTMKFKEELWMGPIAFLLAYSFPHWRTAARRLLIKLLGQSQQPDRPNNKRR